LALNTNAALPAKFVQAIHQVESSGKVGLIYGDSKMSLGPLMISKNCWIDSKISGSYIQCTNLAYSVKVMEAYLNRYCPQSVKIQDFESMARCWNSGPNFAKKKHLTQNYWLKVQKELKKAK